MRQPLHRSIVFTLAFFAMGILNAQLPTPFWTENFTAGIPAGWTSEDESNQNVLWTWCANPLLGDSDPGCSQPWDDALNGQVPFKATTAITGFAVLDSDDPGQLSISHVSQLTTAPINCTGKSQVYITFQTHIGVYSFDAETNAIVRVSTDGTNWTEYTVFPGLTTTERWSENPETPILNISATAANQSNVWIQWEWTGNYEYMWSLDDIELYDQDPTPQNDVAISAFFYPVSSYSTPVSQIASDTFQFEVNLSNKGLNPQTNLVVTAYVKEDGGSTLHTQSISIPSLDPGVSDSNFIFPVRYAPELNTGLYTVGYTLTSDSIDQRPVDNEREDNFVVNNNYFAKEDGPEQGYRPSAGGEWAVANYYRMNGGNFEVYKAAQAEFAFSTNSDEIPIGDVEAALYLFKINNDVAEDFSDFDISSILSSSTEWLGVASYEAPDTIDSYELQRVDISDLNTGLTGVVLEPGGRYLLAMGYEGASSKVFHAFNDDIFYYFPSTFIFNTDWNVNGFGGDVNALLRMYIGLLSTTDEQALPQNTLNIFPNPVHRTLQLGIEFVEPTDATITIADINGRVITFEDRYGLTKETLQYQLPQLASGTYLARIATAKGTLTKKFVVQQ
ncbi:MAG: T9SS type A sorting domain-containing protein [Saprospiraceae bacterium]|nr:T9SS type A sorting domain-containing protein [Saprospiraceae bacterium]